MAKKQDQRRQAKKTAAPLLKSKRASGEAARDEEVGKTGLLPLDGIRVIDLGTFLAGPYAASVMGEFGAEVLKVEHPLAGDPMRRFGTATKRSDATLAWLSEARNRKSVTLDLRQAEGAELFKRLVGKRARTA